MSRPAIPTPVFLIPVMALLVTSMLGETSFGTLFWTLRGESAEERTASLEIAGVVSPEAHVAVATGKAETYITLQIAGKEDDEMSVTVPASWHLEEVRGVDVRDVRMKNSELGMTQLVIPKINIKEQSLEYTFRTSELFDHLAFVPSEASPTLVTLTHITLPEGRTTQVTKIVEDTTVFPLTAL